MAVEVAHFPVFIAASARDPNLHHVGSARQRTEALLCADAQSVRFAELEHDGSRRRTSRAYVARSIERNLTFMAARILKQFICGVDATPTSRCDFRHARLGTAFS
jgi:hypothetical protein